MLFVHQASGEHTLKIDRHVLAGVEYVGFRGTHGGMVLLPCVFFSLVLLTCEEAEEEEEEEEVGTKKK